MQNATHMRRLAVALVLPLALAIPGSAGATARAPKPANVVLTYDCSNMRNPKLAIKATRHAAVEFTRLGTYRWRLRAYPSVGHKIHADLWQPTGSNEVAATRGRLVSGSMEWVIPITALDGCRRA